MTETQAKQHTKLRSLGTLFVLLVVLIIAWTPYLNAHAHLWVEGSILDALTIFGTAKLINGAISVIQSISLSITIFGGVSVNPGEFLDPINDLIESFSWVALAATVSLGLQKLLLDLSAANAFNAILSVAVVFFAVTLHGSFQKNRTLARQLLVFTLILRFCVPVTVLLSQATDQLFISDMRHESHERLLESQSAITQFSQSYQQKGEPEIPESSAPTHTVPPSISAKPPEPVERPSFWDDPEGYWNWEDPSATTDEIDIGAMVDQLEAYLSSESFNENMEETTVSVIDLTVIFVVQTLLFPLLFLYGVIQAFKWAGRALKSAALH